MTNKTTITIKLYTIKKYIETSSKKQNKITIPNYTKCNVLKVSNATINKTHPIANLTVLLAKIILQYNDNYD